jgi:hypothetical protein
MIRHIRRMIRLGPAKPRRSRDVNVEYPAIRNVNTSVDRIINNLAWRKPCRIEAWRKTHYV